MKKTLSIVIMAVMLFTTASAQTDESAWTLNTRAWCTNYWTSLIYGAARSAVVYFVSDDDDLSDGMEPTAVDRILPSADLVFPIGIEKTGFEGGADIQNPYYYAFGHPFKHLGDYAVGFDVSWTPTTVGLYAGAYYKSQEIVFKTNDDHLRGYYIQPRAGIILGRNKATLEAGVFYDKTIGAGGNFNAEKTMLSDGLGLDIAVSFTHSGKSRSIIQFSMPFHNFLNENHSSGLFKDMHRRVGYIMLTRRISF